MLGALRKVFVSDTEHFVSAVSEDNNPNFITDPQKIIKLIQLIIESPPLCTVTVRNFSKTFFTSILDVQKEKNLILFDKLTPPTGNNLLNQHNELKLFTAINGVNLAFNLRNINRDPSAKGVIYTASLPETIFYPQRRTSPRIPTDTMMIDFQGTLKEPGLLIKGNVVDISRTGLCLGFAKSGNNVPSGEKMTNCFIQLPDENPFYFDFTVRSIRKNSQNGPQRLVGGYFNGLSVPNQNKLDRYFCALERRYIRKRKI